MRVHPDQYVAGSIFHVVNHAIDDRKLFYDPGDFLTYLLFLRDRVSPAHSILAYVLMPNHFHFLVRQNTSEPISHLFEQPHKRYARYYNSKYEYKGRIFRERLSHIHLIEEAYILNTCAYIHANPFQANLVDSPEAWEYSNLPEFLGLRHGTLFSPQFVRDWIGNPEAYLIRVKEMAHKKSREKAFMEGIPDW